MRLIKLRGKSLYNLMKFMSGMSFCMYGYDAGVLCGMLLHPPFQEAMGNPTGVWTYPLIVATYDIAAFFTSIFTTTFTFKIGRRGTMLMGNGAAVIGALLQASAYGVPHMIVGRIVTDFAIGSISSSVPTYLNECGSRIHHRGPVNAINAMLLLGGVPIAYWVDYGFVQWDAQANWRIPVIMQCVFALSAGIPLIFMPDTRRWSYARGRHKEGDAVLCQLNDADVIDAHVTETRKQIMTAIEIETQANQKLPWKDFLTSGFVDHPELKIIRRLVIAFWIPMLGEWMGVSLLAYFAPVTPSGIGATPSLISVLSGVISLAFFFGTIPTAGNISAIFFVWLLCPETQGRTLEQVDYLFVERAFAGLRRSSISDKANLEERLAKRAEAGHVEKMSSLHAEPKA